MTQSDYQTKPNSQCGRILSTLKERPGRWVPMPELYLASGAFAVHSRVAELRRRGYLIQCRTWRSGDIVVSEYLLEEQGVI